MAGFLFQWIRGFFRHHGQRRRKPRAARPSRRDVYLFLEPLEDRRLFSLNVWMPQGLNPVGGAGQNSQSLQMFQPAGLDLGSRTGMNSAAVSISANISLVDTGAYHLSLQQSGPMNGGSFVFSEGGTLTFSLSEQGTQGVAGYAITSVVLTQTASLNWSYVQTNGGMTVMSMSGTDSFAVTSLGTSVLDPFFWQGMNWVDPTNRVLQDNNLQMIRMGNSSITVSETKASESYSFGVNSGLATISGNNSQAAGSSDMLEGSQQSYAVSDLERPEPGHLRRQRPEQCPPDQQRRLDPECDPILQLQSL